ncbi:MAG: metalloregulator ArsR/SmtB family transcription factor [Phycisphaerales bacterium]|nr:metalloregulator ArsR/SmtB family transcription factor [Phycisphaerales bacterium]
MSSGDSPGGQLLGRLNALADASRLRMLALLEHLELGVGELATSLQMPQSTASRHLRRLLEAGWVARRSVGVQARYQLAADDLDPSVLAIWQATAEQFAPDRQAIEDRERARAVVAARVTDSRSFFGAVGGEWTALRDSLFGRDAATDALLSLVDPDATVIDLGCGTGMLASRLAPWVERIIAVDRESAMLQAARRRLRDVPTVEFVLGDLDDVELPNGTADIVLAILLMHHIEAPGALIARAKPLLNSGGRLLIVDMVAHDRREYRESMGHLHLGFEPSQIESWAQEAGLAMRCWRRLQPDPDAQGPPLFAAVLSGC